MYQTVNRILLIYSCCLFRKGVRSIVGSILKRRHYHIWDDVVLFLHLCCNLLEPLFVLLELDLTSFFGDDSLVLFELLEVGNDVHAADGAIQVLLSTFDGHTLAIFGLYAAVKNVSLISLHLVAKWHCVFPGCIHAELGVDDNILHSVSQNTLDQKFHEIGFLDVLMCSNDGTTEASRQ